ncbi:MAG: RNA polymerase factor sigma-54, partial [Pseudomonadota bacterium]|nr:RNA polymerase factor sigma-54 [Pseudomonadota bacterium]
MKLSLDIKLGQRLQMTPQLQQAIHMLQMSTLELTTELQQKLEENPFLDLQEESTEDEEIQLEQPPEPALQQDDAPLSFEAEKTEADPAPDYYAEETGPDYASAAPPRTRNDYDDAGALEARSSAPQTLRELLHSQAALIPFSRSDRLIADSLIECIDDRGYLDASIEEVQTILAGELAALPEEIEAVLHQLQNFEPAGVGARDPRECLLLQLRALDPGKPGLDTARALVDKHLLRLAKKEYDQLCRALKVDRDGLREAVKLIRRLNPHPGLVVAPADTSYIVPDVVARQRRGKWVVEPNPQAVPKLIINRDYQALMRRVAGNTNGQLKEQMQHARWLLGSLEKRQQTVLSVAQAIVHRQQGFLDRGDRALRPMVLRDVAEEL